MNGTSYYVTKENLPFLKYEGLCELQQLNSIRLAGENYKSNNKTCSKTLITVVLQLLCRLQHMRHAIAHTCLCTCLKY